MGVSVRMRSCSGVGDFRLCVTTGYQVISIIVVNWSYWVIFGSFELIFGRDGGSDRFGI